ncbi:hypothetical protein [Lignipirellula cremea]|uniref:Uncharacterized protein n=1 Tax=Lignipirellula cremea TaxID=2528010 RepID=A0A518DV66_9BACT|nr:hypothetical protein [Lignipirellula cremea]QDU95729.1 hypothetical protein Pla8534_35460 [Lignipirellula cremea]
MSLVCLVQARLANPPPVNPPPVNPPYVTQEFWSSLLFYGSIGTLQVVAGGYWQQRAFLHAQLLNAFLAQLLNAFLALLLNATGRCIFCVPGIFKADISAA